MNSLQIEGLEKVPFTPTETRIMELLADGKEHTKEELQKCLPDDQGSSYQHIHRIRPKIRAVGFIITIVMRNRNANYILSKSLD